VVLSTIVAVAGTGEVDIHTQLGRMNSGTVRTVVGVEMGIPVGAHSCEERCTPVDSVAVRVSGAGMLRGRNTLAVLAAAAKCLRGWDRCM
jgi:hypothetical protein